MTVTLRVSLARRYKMLGAILVLLRRGPFTFTPLSRSRPCSPHPAYYTETMENTAPQPLAAKGQQQIGDDTSECPV